MAAQHKVIRWLKAVRDGWRDWKRKYKTRVAYAIMDSTLPAPRRALLPPHLHQTAADRLEWLCQRYSATFEIHRPNDGVLVLLKFPDMSVISSGVRSSMVAAVEALYVRVAP